MLEVGFIFPYNLLKNILDYTNQLRHCSNSHGSPRYRHEDVGLHGEPIQKIWVGYYLISLIGYQIRVETDKNMVTRLR